jgi:predicted RNase H-like HicB family nuclease
MPHYIALIEKEAGTDFGVYFPDFPGCVSAGATLDEAKEMAVEALTGHLRCMRQDGEAVPEPSSLEAVMRDPDNARAVAFLVSIPDEKPRSVRLNITLSEPLLQRIDAHAKSRGLSRSAFLAVAAQQSISESKQP